MAKVGKRQFSRTRSLRKKSIAEPNRARKLRRQGALEITAAEKTWESGFDPFKGLEFPLPPGSVRQALDDDRGDR